MTHPTFVTVVGVGQASTFGPFWTDRSVRRWLNHREEMELGAGGDVVAGRWRLPRAAARG